MGNDGGSIPDRTSQIRVKKRKRRINKVEIQKTKSNLCSMTKEQLRKPIVVKELKCTINDNGYIQCQISQEEFSGLNKFFFLWTCGCVFSKTAMDELDIKKKCINCNSEFDINKDLISLNYNKNTKREILKSLLNIKYYNNSENTNEINLLKHKTKRNKEI